LLKSDFPHSNALNSDEYSRPDRAGWMWIMRGKSGRRRWIDDQTAEARPGNGEGVVCNPHPGTSSIHASSRRAWCCLHIPDREHAHSDRFHSSGHFRFPRSGIMCRQYSVRKHDFRTAAFVASAAGIRRPRVHRWYGCHHRSSLFRSLLNRSGGSGAISCCRAIG
jgi:hypothetical protein